MITLTAFAQRNNTAHVQVVWYPTPMRAWSDRVTLFEGVCRFPGRKLTRAEAARFIADWFAREGVEERHAYQGCAGQLVLPLDA